MNVYRVDSATEYLVEANSYAEAIENAMNGTNIVQAEESFPMVEPLNCVIKE